MTRLESMGKAFDIVLRVPTARHSFRQDLSRTTRSLDSNCNYSFAVWWSSGLPHMPGLNFSLKTMNDEVVTGCVVGIAVLFKQEVTTHGVCLFFLCFDEPRSEHSMDHTGWACCGSGQSAPGGVHRQERSKAHKIFQHSRNRGRLQA